MISNILGASWFETKNQVSESGGPGGQVIPNLFPSMHLLSAFQLYCTVSTFHNYSDLQLPSPLPSAVQIWGGYPMFTRV